MLCTSTAWAGKDRIVEAMRTEPLAIAGNVRICAPAKNEQKNIE